MRFRWAVLTSAVAVIAGCVNTSMTSQVNRLAIPTPPERILVVGNFADLSFRDRAESRLCGEIARKTRAECFRSLDYTPPGRFTQEDLAAAVEAIPADAALFLSATGTSISTAYIPPTTSTTGSATVVGNTAYGQSTTRTYGGYNVNKPNAGFEAVLWNGPGDSPAWYATAAASGNAFHEWDDLISATAGQTVDKLLEDGVLDRRAR